MAGAFFAGAFATGFAAAFGAGGAFFSTGAAAALRATRCVFSTAISAEILSFLSVSLVMLAVSLASALAVLDRTGAFLAATFVAGLATFVTVFTALVGAAFFLAVAIMDILLWCPARR